MAKASLARKLVAASFAATLTIILFLFLGLKIYIVLGTSMKPTLSTGDIVVAVSPRIVKPELGRIVIAEINGKVLVHRIVYLNNTIVITKGDNNPTSDPPTSIHSVRGVAVLVLPREIYIPIIIALASLALTSNRLITGYYRLYILTEAIAALASLLAPIIVVLIATSPHTPIQPNITIYPHPTITRADIANNTIILEIRLDHGQVMVEQYKCTIYNKPTIVIYNETNGLLLSKLILTHLNSSIVNKILKSHNVQLNCSIKFSKGLLSYEYTFSMNIPVAGKPKLAITQDEFCKLIRLKVYSTPGGLPYNATIVVIGCGMKKVANIILKPHTTVELKLDKWHCNYMYVGVKEPYDGGVLTEKIFSCRQR